MQSETENDKGGWWKGPVVVGCKKWSGRECRSADITELVHERVPQTLNLQAMHGGN